MSLSKIQDEKRWQCVVIYLKKTTDVLHPYIKDRLNNELDQWSFNAKENIKQFSEKVNSIRGYLSFTSKGSGGTWTVREHDATCQDILRKILSIHTNPKKYNIEFASNDWIKCTDVEPYWILAKMFMPYGNKTSGSPDESDMLSFFDLLRNCRCFSSDFDAYALDELCTARYTVTGKTSLSKIEMDEIIALMKLLLNTSCLKYQHGVENLLTELNRLKSSSAVYLTSFDISSLQKVMEDYFPGTQFSRAQLSEGSCQLYNWFLNDGMKTLNEETRKKNAEMDEGIVKKIQFQTIGGAAGAIAVGGTGAAAVGATAALLGTSLLAAPVVVPAVVLGSVGAGIGYIGGKAGGGVIAMFKKIL